MVAVMVAASSRADQEGEVAGRQEHLLHHCPAAIPSLLPLLCNRDCCRHAGLYCCRVEVKMTFAPERWLRIEDVLYHLWRVGILCCESLCLCCVS